MKLSFSKIAAILFFNALIFNSFSQRNDAALWAGIELDKGIYKKLDGHLKMAGRLNENFTHADYSFIDLGVDFKLNKYIGVTSAYVMNFKNSRMGNDWNTRHQWYGNVKLKYKLGDFKFTNRNQLQTNLEDSRTNRGDWFYRNKTKITYQINKQFSPYIGYEAYFLLGYKPQNERGTYRNRYTAGLEYSLNKRSSFSLGYLVQTQTRRNAPDRIFAITAGYSHSFKGNIISTKKKK